MYSFIAHSPHFDFCFLKGVRNKIHVLKGGDDALLFACHVGVKGQDSGISWQGMLQNKISKDVQYEEKFSFKLPYFELTDGG